MKVSMLVCALVLATVGSAPAQMRPGPDPARPLIADSLARATGGGDTLRRVVTLPVFEVTTTRADWRAPLAITELSRSSLLANNWGQDTPMLLSQLPGAYAYSDAGNGIGYSYLSLRGFPQRRISVTINGVPLNDPESHEVYWIDHPDLLASTELVQVQRGVGSALYGAASVGGSVNLETAPFRGQPSGSASMSYGSLATRRYMLEQDSGDLEGGWNFYGRYSRIETDGYRDRSDTELWSYALSARKHSGAHVFRVNLYGGPETTHLAYLGVPREYLDGAVTGDRDRDRRFNPITYDGERDHFFEPHYEGIHSWRLSSTVGLTQTLFYFDGQGYYDEQRFGQNLADYRLTPWATTDSTLLPRTYYAQDATGALVQDGAGRFTVERFDLVRRRFVANRHYGWVPRVRIAHRNGVLTVGGELRAHDGRHVGTLVSGDGLPPATEADHRYYDYHPHTLAAGAFAHEEWWGGGALRVTADIGWRHQDYLMRGDHFDGIRFDQPYDFALPRVGLNWWNGGRWRFYASAAHSRREPAFRDLFDGEGVGSVPLIVAGKPLIRPERVNDYEAGAGYHNRRIEWTANLFRMDFRDELVYAGQFNTDLGYPILGNAARSVHQGVEISASSGFGSPPYPRPSEGPPHAFGSGPWREVAVVANATLSDNHFVEYREVYGTTPADVVRYDGNAIGFFPAMMGNLAIRAGTRGVVMGLETQYAGRIYLDNTESKDASIPQHAVLNLSAAYSRPVTGNRAEVRIRVLNLLDKRYETSGYMDYDAGGNLVPQFIPAATRQILGEVRLNW